MVQKSEAFNAALKEARVVEVARIEALLAVNDARALRLEHLRDLIAPDLGGDTQGRPLFGLRLEAGETPRLWLDLAASVVMEPNPRTYRVVEMHQSSQDTVFESEDAKAVHQFVLRYLARGKLQDAMSPASKVSTLENGSVFKAALMWIGALSLLCAALAVPLLYCRWVTIHFG